MFLISKFYFFSWNEILDSAHKKIAFSDEDLIARLKTFPMILLDKIKVIDENFLREIKQEFLNLIEEIIQKSENKKQ